MIPPKILFSNSSKITNLRKLPILKGLYRAFRRAEDKGHVEVSFSGEPDYHFTLEFPICVQSSQKVIYYDVEGLYEPFFPYAPDIIFTVEENAVKPLREFYDCPVFHLPLGFDPELYSSREVPQEIDITFCGTLFDPRPAVLSWLVPLSEQYSIQVITPTSWASRFKNTGKVKILSDVEWFHPEDIIQAYLSSKIILCINRSKQNKNGTFNKTIGRGFGETALRRCVFIDESREVFPHFISGEELITFSIDDSGENLRALLSYYLRTNSARQKIANKGFERAFKDHTWDSRTSTILKALNALA